MSQVKSPQYIKSVTVINCANLKYNLFLRLENNSSQKFINICPISKKTFEYEFTKDGAAFVNPIAYVNLTTNSGCGEQIDKYSLSSSEVNSVVELILTIDKYGRVSSSIKK